MSKRTAKRILVSPLDWGLGHTTRCLPLIRAVKALGHSVVVACNQWQRSFIEQLHADIEFINLDGYNVTYSRSSLLSKLVLLKQLPGMYSAVKREHAWLAANAAQLDIDGIISDNRYGLYHHSIPSVILTHQLQLQTGGGARTDRLVQRIHYRHLQKFGEVWVPDVAGDVNLGGVLSHPKTLPANCRYIGLLSQFEFIDKPVHTDGYLLILLSGPEPQRTLLQEKLLLQLPAYTGRVVFVTGSDRTTPANDASNIVYYGRINGSQLAQLIQDAHTVVCRSGYSSIMDLVLLGKQAILIPTPGQTEQEYLARYLSDRGMFTAAQQHTIDLQAQLGQNERISHKLPELNTHYKDHIAVLQQWIAGLG